MEITNELHIMIFCTLEKIERINALLVLHQTQKMPSELSILQYEEQKKAFEHDLFQLLQQTGVNAIAA
jgi:hypothetical protein